jgi:hypothetical protein
MKGNHVSKPKLDLFITKSDDKYVVSLKLPNGQICCFNLEYMTFGSAKSLDCDGIIQVPQKFIDMNFNSHTYNKICEILDNVLMPILGTKKKVNSSIGHWENGQITWSQKGSDIAEVNNSIISTFSLHPTLQMFEECPLTVMMKRNVWEKIMITARDILCKMNKSCYISDDPIFTETVINSIFNIKEINSMSENELKLFVHALLRGYFLNKKTSAKICQVLPKLIPHCNVLKASSENKKKKLKSLNQIISAILGNKPIDKLVHKIIMKNLENKKHAAIICEALEEHGCEGDPELLKLYHNETDPGFIQLNRLIRHLRKRQDLGTRLDMLSLLNFEHIKYLMNDVDIKDRFKDICAKISQTLALMDGIELYDKADFAKRYPKFAVFLWRMDHESYDLINLTQFVHSFVDRVRSYDGYSRDMCENLRHNQNE